MLPLTGGHPYDTSGHTDGYCNPRPAMRDAQAADGSSCLELSEAGWSGCCISTAAPNQPNSLQLSPLPGSSMSQDTIQAAVSLLHVQPAISTVAVLAEPEVAHAVTAASTYSWHTASCLIACTESVSGQSPSPRSSPNHGPAGAESGGEHTPAGAAKSSNQAPTRSCYTAEDCLHASYGTSMLPAPAAPAALVPAGAVSGPSA